MKLAENEEEMNDSQVRKKYLKRNNMLSNSLMGLMFCLAEMVSYFLYRSFLIIIQSWYIFSP